MCTVLLPLGDNSIAVNKYIIQLFRNVETLSARQFLRPDASHLKLLNISLLHLVLDLHTKWFHLGSY
jgi:hypothetical protein